MFKNIIIFFIFYYKKKLIIEDFNLYYRHIAIHIIMVI